MQAQDQESGFSVAAFEHYMAADDSPSYPMNLLWRLEFSGALDPQQLDHAVRRALDRHPLLRCRLSGPPSERLSNLRWIASSEPLSPIVWYRGDRQGLMQEIHPLVASRDQPVRIFAHQQCDQTELLLQFHHSATDGQGVAAFLEDVVLYYNQKEASPLAMGEWEAYRHSFGLTYRESLSRAPLEARHALESILRPALPLAHGGRVDQGPVDLPFRGSRRIDLSPAEVADLKEFGRRYGATLNDLLVMAFFRALHAWNRRHGVLSKRIRVSVPVNLRPPGARFPACNLVGMCFINLPAKLIQERSLLLQSIRQETQRIRQRRLGLTLVRSIQLASRVRGGRAYDTGGSRRCHATGVLTNLGIVLGKAAIPKTSDGKVRMQDHAILERVSTFPPIRPNTPFTTGVITYGGTLAVCLSYDRGWLDRDEAEEFLQSLRCELNSGAI
jgi:NRPS condensation-like uncharacterized protein